MLGSGSRNGYLCEYIRDVEFSCNVDYFYLFEVDAFSDVVIAETDVLHSLCCEVFEHSTQALLSL